MKTNKLVVVGVGHVGSYVLADAMKTTLFGEIAVIDVEERIARGEAIDQFHATGVPTLAPIHVHAGEPTDYADADVIIIAAGTSVQRDPERPNAEPDRVGLAAHSAVVIRQVMGDIAAQTRDAVVIVITNPLDTITYIAANEFGYPAGRVFGTGTMLDSARLRALVAADYGIDPGAVTGYMMGEHGKTAFPVLSHLTVAGVPYAELHGWLGGPAPLAPEQMAKRIVSSAFEVLNGKGWTNAGVAQAALQLARHVMLDSHAIVPVASTLGGEYGLADVVLSMPCELGREGVLRRLPVDLDEWEQAALSTSAAYIRQTMALVGAGVSASGNPS